jgi:hypothetical protein
VDLLSLAGVVSRRKKANGAVPLPSLLDSGVR